MQLSRPNKEESSHADLSPPSMVVDTSLYDLLGVSPRASEGELNRSSQARAGLTLAPADIKKAYRRKVGLLLNSRISIT